MKWIPCSERLPDVKPQCYCADDGQELYESEEVLVWGRQEGEPFEYGLATLVLDKADSSMEWSGLVGWMGWNAVGCEIVAWCPLPKPFLYE